MCDNEERAEDIETISTSMFEEIDRICLAFETALKAGGSPRIETVLVGRGDVERSKLFLELLVLELDYRCHRGQLPSPLEYHARFPDDSKMIINGFERSKQVGLPTTIGKYRIISQLPPGGQAFVYRVVHPTLETELALKISRDAVSIGQSTRDHLVAEGRLLAELDHPNIARVYDMDIHEGRPFLVLEYVRGRNLRQHVQSRPTSPRDTAKLVAKVARALHAAHTHGIVHQDVKPANVMVDQNGEPRVIDFGLARIRNAWGAESDAPDDVSGTAQFMAPEQARGEEVGPCSDLFGLGAVLYWLVTGQAPFAGKNFHDSLNRARRCEYDRAALARAKVSHRLQTIVMKAMAAEPAARYSTAEHLAEDLERYAERSNRRLPFALAACAAIIFLAGGYLLIHSLQDRSSVAFEIRLDILAGRGETSRPLHRAVPVYSGDDVHVTWQLPAMYRGTLFWHDTEGKLHELPAMQLDPDRFVWPSSHGFQEVVGPAGTEFIFVCARQGKAPTKDEVETLIGTAVWPPLLDDALVEVVSNGVTIRRRSADRGPGTKERLDVVRQHAENLRAVLAEKYDLFFGIAFRHSEPPATLQLFMPPRSDIGTVTREDVRDLTTSEEL